MTQNPLQATLTYYGISPWEIEVIYGLLRERFEVLFQEFPHVKMEIPELKLEILSKEVVLVNFHWKVYPMGQGPAFSGIGSGIYTFNDGQWKEILEVERITEVDEALKQE